MIDQDAKNRNFKTIDERIADANFDKLEQELLPNSVQASATFDNRFFNQFVNSPNFTKNI